MPQKALLTSKDTPTYFLDVHIKEINFLTIYNDKDKAIKYGQHTIKRAGFLDENQNYHIDDMHVYVEEVVLQHGVSPQANIPASQVSTFHNNEINVIYKD